MTRTTDEVIDRFNRAFRERDATLLEDIIALDCVMESVQPAPDGTRYEGYDASFSSWEALIDDTTSHFEVEDVHTGDEWALIRWRYVWGPGPDSPVPSPTVTPRSRTGPMTWARSRRILSSITDLWKSRMPSVRIRVPLKPGRWQSEIRTVLVVASTNRGASSSRQRDSTRAWLIPAAITSRRPLIRAPTSRIAGARPFSRSPAPSSKAITTSA